MMHPDQCDVAILGGGLAGALAALALAERRPELSIVLIEAGDRIGGHHVWSFFESDIEPADRWLVAPLVCHSWQGHDVIFPRHARTLPGAYHTIQSERLDEVVRAKLAPEALLTGRRVHTAGPTSVLLDDGTRIDAGAVIDARGTGDLGKLDLGWQKFVGQELRLAQPHGLTRPIIMDATVEQIDGYRFVYVLPFGPDRLFVEDTYYSDRPALAVRTIAPRIRNYAAGRGWKVVEVLREEQGVLPVAMGGDFEAYWRSGGDGVGKAGMRAGLFHPLTGYSIPDAVRTAISIAAMPVFEGEALHDRLHEAAKTAWRKGGFYRMLCRMLFRAALPDQRWKVLAQFYRRDRRLIARFYKGQSTTLDKLRMLAGRPPVPISRALRAIGGKL
jgi:lycopene beta-cyclase